MANDYYNAPAQEWDFDFMLADSDEHNNYPNTRPTSSSTFDSLSPPAQRTAHRDLRAEADELRQAHSERRAQMGNAQSAQANGPSHPHLQQPSEVIDLVNTNTHPASSTSQFPRIPAPSPNWRADQQHRIDTLHAESEAFFSRQAQLHPHVFTAVAAAEREQEQEQLHSSNNDSFEDLVSDDELERASNASWDSSIDGGIEHMYPLRTDGRGRLRAVRRNSDADGDGGSEDDGGDRDRHSGFQFDRPVVDLTEEELEASLNPVPTRTGVEQQGHRGVKRRAGGGEDLRSGHGSASASEGASNKRRKPAAPGASSSTRRRPARPTNNAGEEVESLDLTGSPTTISAEAKSQAQQQQDMIAQQQSSSEQPQRIGKRTCIICMEPYTNATITSCGHIYCHECLTMALKAGEKNSERGMGNCPVCRKSVSRKKTGGMVPVAFMTKKSFAKGKGRRSAG
ncbi:hypothetical protein LTR56_018222 [Elasticomyces elasticus]|nr:hypothetical protein LTR56_018222 [Elasticomyces elasticus]KAK3664044.1 hypothetical protein LTR22_005007 [Elasticomyces elasticus]KAK4927613.1 hypothetical protein LTR49_005481 [Elasticomyces elasticus]KAK5766985.1 hypothetical protein LTS12_002749 [Elasticomyces elasticus]